MNFLVTNDDGVFAPGIEAMVSVLQHFGQVYVVCPDQERSAISHSITLRQPLKAKQVVHFPGCAGAWAVNGTPADCVKMGIEVLLKEKPDIVFSGINLGPNLGRDLFYSGTMAGAAEATFYGIPSIAVSLNAFSEEKVKFPQINRLFYEVVEAIIQNKIPKGTFLNINLPNLSREMCKGISIVPLNMSISRYKFVGLNDPQGHIYYWLRDELNRMEDYGEDSCDDYSSLIKGYITISPIELKATQKRKIDQLQRWFKNANIKFSKEEVHHG